MIVLGDCREVLRDLPDGYATAVVTDPPYGLEFMGKEWDKFGGGRTSKPGIGERSTEWVNSRGWNEWRCANCGHLPHGGSPCACEKPDMRQDMNRWIMYQDQMRQIFTECLRVLRPGGHALIFGGTRTFHRLACAVEDAGFEIRDCLAWLYGQGFPKSKNVEGGYGTALKPAWEPILLARRPLVGTVAANVMEHGTGALNIDGCRIEGGERPHIERRNDKALDGDVYGSGINGSRSLGTFLVGRWPANVVLDEDAAAMLDEQAPETGQAASLKTRNSDKRGRSCYGTFQGSIAADFEPHDGLGGASRFFYCAKASKRDRGEGNSHPTVKPVELMRWLVRLVSGPIKADCLILDPFAGSGTTGVACAMEGVPFLLIEREQSYVEIVERRLKGIECES